MVREGLDRVFRDGALCCFAFPVPGSGEQGEEAVRRVLYPVSIVLLVAGGDAGWETRSLFVQLVMLLRLPEALLSP